MDTQRDRSAIRISFWDVNKNPEEGAGRKRRGLKNVSGDERVKETGREGGNRPGRSRGHKRGSWPTEGGGDSPTKGRKREEKRGRTDPSGGKSCYEEVNKAAVRQRTKGQEACRHSEYDASGSKQRKRGTPKLDTCCFTHGRRTGGRPGWRTRPTDGKSIEFFRGILAPPPGRRKNKFGKCEPGARKSRKQ